MKDMMTSFVDMDGLSGKYGTISNDELLKEYSEEENMMDNLKVCLCNGTGPCQCTSPKVEQVNHPQHYGGKNNPYEAIKVIDAWDLGFSLGNTVKYISRAGKKGKDKELEDLRKALWYLQHHIETLEK